MRAKHFVVWTDGTRTHVASMNAYRRGEAAWRHDVQGTVPDCLVDELGWWDWQMPANGPFPAFAADRLAHVADWLRAHGCTVRVLDGQP